MKNSRPVRAAAIQRPPRPGSLDLPLFLVLAVALIVRAAYHFSSQSSPFYAPMLLDPGYYQEWALRILSGRLSEPEVFYGLPLYPYFVAAVYKLSGAASLDAVKWVQIGFSLLTVFWVYRTTELLSGRRAAIFAGTLGAVYGPLFFHEAIQIPESIGVALYAAAFYAACRFTEDPTARRGAVLGVLCGLAALTKAGILLFAILWPAWMGWRRFLAKDTRSARACLCAIAACLVTLAPVTAHNWLRAGDPVLLTSHSGFNFYIGNNEKAEGVFAAPEGTGSNVETQARDSRAIAERAMGRPLKASEVSRYWSDRAWAFIRSDPGRALWLAGRKLLLFFDAREISDINDYAFEKRINKLLAWPWIDFAVLGPLVFAGLLVSARNSGRYPLILCWTLSYLAGILAFFVNARYRLPLLGVFLPLAGMALQDLSVSLAGKRYRRFAALLLCMAAGIVVGQLQLIEKDRSKDWINAGDTFLKRGEYARALDWYQEAIKISPDSPKANLAMGVALSGLKRHDEAKNHYLRSIASEPNSQAFNNLGLWYDSKGLFEEAEKSFLKAVELEPQGFQAYNNLGMIYGKAGRWREAEGMFRKALILNPSSARVHTNLGMVLAQTGRVEDARRLWQEALRLDPAFEDARRALGATTR